MRPAWRARHDAILGRSALDLHQDLFTTYGVDGCLPFQAGAGMRAVFQSSFVCSYYWIILPSTRQYDVVRPPAPLREAFERVGHFTVLFQMGRKVLVELLVLVLYAS